MWFVSGQQKFSTCVLIASYHCAGSQTTSKFWDSVWTWFLWFHFFAPHHPHPISYSQYFFNIDTGCAAKYLFSVACHSLDTHILMCHRCLQLGTVFSCFIGYLILIISLPLHSSPVITQQATAWALLAACCKAVQSKWSSCFLILPIATGAVCFKDRICDSSCKH